MFVVDKLFFRKNKIPAIPYIPKKKNLLKSNRINERNFFDFFILKEKRLFE